MTMAQAWEVGDFEEWAAQLPNPAESPGLSKDYQFTGHFFSRLAQRAAERPGVLTVEVIGKSVNQVPIVAFHVRDPVTPVSRKVLIFAGIHSLEWISTEVAVRLLEQLIDHPPEGVSVTVIPVLNPDGRARVERDLLAGENRYRRGNGKNIDLNRDFAVHRDAIAIWKAILPRRYASSPAPLSQPETRALDALAARERYHRAASLHAFGGFFYYPWSGRFARPPHHREFVALGRTMEAAMGPKAYKTKELSRWGFFFRAQGSEIDHLYGLYGTKAFLVEITRSGLNPFKPKTFKQYFRWYNPKHPEHHRDQVSRALRALINAPTLPSEETWPPAISPFDEQFPSTESSTP